MACWPVCKQGEIEACTDKSLRRIHLISRETEAESSHGSGQLICNGQQNTCLHAVYSEWD